MAIPRGSLARGRRPSRGSFGGSGRGKGDRDGYRFSVVDIRSGMFSPGPQALRDLWGPGLASRPVSPNGTVARNTRNPGSPDNAMVPMFSNKAPCPSSTLSFSIVPDPRTTYATPRRLPPIRNDPFAAWG